MDTLLGGSSIGGTGTLTVNRTRTPSQPQWIRPMRRSRSQIPSTTASIPSRYQTFFYSSGENKGFNSQATRFADHLGTNDIPGPGTYSTQPESLEKFSTSFSRKGAGGLASKNERFSRIRLEKVGPASYTPRLPVDHHDFNRANTSKNFHCPIAAKTDTEKWSPAPNTYNVNRLHMERNSIVTGEAAFKSKTPREIGDLCTASNPGPSKYEVLDELVHPSVCPYSSVFKSKSGRNGHTKPKRGPGPADYSPHERKQQLLRLPYFRSKHYLCFSAPALPLPPVPPQPGPGHYEIMDKLSIGTEKDVSGAVFKSITGRMLPQHDTKLKPGPGQYNPVSEVKRSYFYNVHSVWV